MKINIYLIIVLCLLTGCNRLLYIHYDEGKLNQIFPYCSISCGIDAKDTTILFVNIYLRPFDSIRVINLIPILNKKDTMHLRNWNYDSLFHRYHYYFISSKSIIESNGFDFIVDVMFYERGLEKRYTDTIFIKEKDRLYQTWINDVIPSFGH